MNARNRLSAVASLVAAGALAVSCGGGGGGGGGGGQTYTIGGAVTGPWVEGVTVTLGGAATATVTTGANGAYAFANLANGTYTVTPALAGYTFTPATASVTISGANQTQGFAAASTIASYTLSGTVTYSGSKTGRVYLVATGGNGAVRGTSIAAPGTYTIRGLTPGTYVVLGRLDALGHGAENAGDPVGTSGSVVIDTTSVAGADVALADPPAPTADVPTGLVAAPGAGSVVLFWEVAGWPGTEKATSYDLSWGTNPGATNLGELTGIAARDDAHYVQTGLTDGTTLYYKVRSCVGAACSAYSTVAGPVQVGAVAGGSTVSGSVTFPGTATGPLYVAVQDAATGQMRIAAVAAPTSPASYAVSGIPNGRHAVYAILDQNANHVVDEGDLSNTNALGTVVDVTGNATAVNVALAATKAVAQTYTHHVAPPSGSNTWVIAHRVARGVRRPLTVTITSGKGLPLPLDAAAAWEASEVWADLGTAAPAVGDAYGYSVTYDDGTSEALASSVTGVLDAFPTSLAEDTATPYSAGAPLLTWAAPASPPASYGYIVQFWGSADWYFPDSNVPLPSATTSIEYNYDGNASPAILTTGDYAWGVSVVDANGNRATRQKIYTVP